MHTIALIVLLTLQASPDLPGSDEVGVEPPLLETLGDSSPDWWWRSPDAKRLRRPLVDDSSVPDGWIVVGGPADFWVEGVEGDPVLHGSGDSDRNAFLVDPTILGDFLLECDVMIPVEGGNSGIQIRSEIDDDRMIGYQIEIDPTPRAWSGGLYDEGRRGWLKSLVDNLDGRAAFVPGKWNRYEILAVGPRIRSWVNGVPTVDHIDFMNDRGLVGFQVHSGGCEVSWRRLGILDLGLRESRVIHPASDGGSGSTFTDGVVGPDGLDLTMPTPLPDGPCGLTIEASIERGSVIVELGDVDRGPGYRLTVPAPLGTEESPGRIMFWRWRDRMRVFVDDVPLEPGPPDLDGPLEIRIHAEPGVVAKIHRITDHPPTRVEIDVIGLGDSTDE